MMGPIENVASFSKTVVYLVAIAGAVILALILTLSIKERMYETGVFLSMGEGKMKIVAVVLEFDSVSYGYANGGNRVDILKDASVSFEKGVFYTIIGPTGSGKTTSLALAGALDVPQKGRVLFDGKDIRKIGLTRHRKRNVALIFQNYNLITYMTALENVTMAMELSGSYKGERKQQALKLLKNLGLTTVSPTVG